MRLEDEIKNLIISSLDLEDMSPEDIQDEEPLFTEGLGLDSIDALELGMAIRKKYNLTPLEAPEGKIYFILCQKEQKYFEEQLKAEQKYTPNCSLFYQKS